VKSRESQIKEEEQEGEKDRVTNEVGKRGSEESKGGGGGSKEN